MTDEVKNKKFQCNVHYHGKLIASDIFEGEDEDDIYSQAKNSFIEWLEFETIELDDKGKPVTIKIDKDI